MKQLQHLGAVLTVLGGSLFASGCTTTLVVMHVYDRVTEGDPAPCVKLNSVQRALQERCGVYVQGSLSTQDVASSGLPICPLTLATSNPKFWPVLPDLIDKGAKPESCQESPWAALARTQPCPDLMQASPAARQSLRWLAEADARAVQHDVVRALSCPLAREAGFDQIVDAWAANGQMQAGQIGFGALSALHPSHLHSPLARTLESQGHSAAAGLGSYSGSLAPGFEEALRTSDFAALDWWLDRVPSLAQRAPPTRGDQLPWIPLARVLTPAFMPNPALQRQSVEYLLSRGANPWQGLPHDPSRSVVTLARQLKSPLLETLEAPRPVVPTATAAAATAAPAAKPR
jgi:hypothetical protein